MYDTEREVGEAVVQLYRDRDLTPLQREDRIHNIVAEYFEQQRDLFNKEDE